MPAILATGDTGEPQLRRIASAGAAVLHKPFNLATLSQMLRTLLQAAGSDPERPS